MFHIRETLPELKLKISQQLVKCRTELSELGDPLDGDGKDLLVRFCRCCRPVSFVRACVCVCVCVCVSRWSCARMSRSWVRARRSVRRGGRI
jgi:hypothetical protein